jgi:predicted nuclease of predicted toxin-antitoxin system
MPVPAIYLDECVHLALVQALQQRGFVATAAAREGLTRLDDEQQLAHATAQDWLLLTYNRKDFERLHRAYQRSGRPHSGIMVLQQRPSLSIQEIRAAMMLDWITTLPVRHSRLFTWAQLQHLLDQGYRVAGYSDTEIDLAYGRRLV